MIRVYIQAMNIVKMIRYEVSAIELALKYDLNGIFKRLKRLNGQVITCAFKR